VKKRVLIVGQTTDDRDMYVEFLQAHGYAVVTCDDAQQALTEAKRADIVVTGIRLDGPLDGIELLRQLRTRRWAGTLPVVVLTACAFESDRQRAESAGCDVFITKPCLPSTLATSIDQALKRRRPTPLRMAVTRRRVSMRSAANED
jgi:two-component system, cell cycle response regulator DivK